MATAATERYLGRRREYRSMLRSWAVTSKHQQALEIEKLAAKKSNERQKIKLEALIDQHPDSKWDRNPNFTVVNLTKNVPSIGHIIAWSVISPGARVTGLYMGSLKQRVVFDNTGANLEDLTDSSDPEFNGDLGYLDTAAQLKNTIELITNALNPHIKSS